MEHSLPSPWQRPGGLSSSALKLLAAGLMVVDHLAHGWVLKVPWGIDVGQVGHILSNEGGLFWGSLMVLLGRAAFPIFCFFAVQGALLTRSPKKMLLRLLIFALISEPAFDLLFFDGLTGAAWGHQNVLFTLLMGAWGIFSAEKISARVKDPLATVLLQLAVFVSLAMLAQLARVDYGAHGIYAMYLFYMGRDSRRTTFILGLLAFLFEAQLYGTVYLGLLLIMLYNGRRGQLPKYFFYAFYPGHLLLLYLLRWVLTHPL
ncbi:MAG: TraX family protein [Tissierellia bacterium]|nr:TraX family protein [Tissierellia bacterium]